MFKLIKEKENGRSGRDGEWRQPTATLCFVKGNRRADAGGGRGAKGFVLSCQKLQCAYMPLGIIK